LLPFFVSFCDLKIVCIVALSSLEVPMLSVSLYLSKTCKINHMATKEISDGTVHKMPADLRKALAADEAVLTLWGDITPLARNEFICWIENAKQIETRNRRVKRTCQELLEGNRRPCCWIGCIHRPDKPISRSVRWVLDKQSKNSS
jgi:hypothetical protein